MSTVDFEPLTMSVPSPARRASEEQPRWRVGLTCVTCSPKPEDLQQAPEYAASWTRGK